MEVTIVLNRFMAFICTGLAVALVLAIRKINRLTKSEAMNWDWYKTEASKNIILTDQLNMITSANIKLSEQVSRVSGLNKTLMSRKENVCKIALLCVLLYCMYKKLMESLLMEMLLFGCVVMHAIISIIKVRTQQQLTDQQEIICALNAEVKRWSDEKFFWYNSYVFWLKQCEEEQAKIERLTASIESPQKLMNEIENLKSIKQGKYNACIYWDKLASEKQEKHAQLKKEYEEMIKKVADLKESPHPRVNKKTKDDKVAGEVECHQEDEETSEEDMTTSDEDDEEYIRFVVNYDNY
jgi:hypothetical protein